MDPTEKLRAAIGRANFSHGHGDLRKIIDEIDERLKEERSSDGPTWKPAAIDPDSGYRKLPSWVAQPYIRPKPISAEVPTNADGMASGETVANATSESSQALLPDVPLTNIAQEEPVTNTGQRCSYESCGSIGAMRCPTNHCLIHCRLHNAMAAGQAEEEAMLAAKQGGLVGLGCEAHEEKAKARMERQNGKRKHREEMRTVWKAARQARKSKKRKDGQQDQVEEDPEEVEMN